MNKYNKQQVIIGITKDGEQIIVTERDARTKQEKKISRQIIEWKKNKQIK